MNQIIGCIDILECRSQLIQIEGVRSDDLYIGPYALDIPVNEL